MKWRLKLLIVLILGSSLFAAPVSFAANTFGHDVQYTDLYGPHGVQAYGNSIQNRLDYVARTDGQPIYFGYAVAGKASSDDAWLVYKYTYDGSDHVTLKQSAFGIWDNRASLTYS